MLDSMSWREFEMLVGEGFRLQGYSVAENFEPGPDEGIDLKLRKDGETYLVQCKQWRAFKVGVPVVRELYGVMAAKGAAGGFVVTSGRFTAEAEAFAEGRNVRLLDGPKLERMLKQARGDVGAPRAAAAPVPQSQGSCARTPGR
jgi:restriction system protein